ncbi:MAG: GNAT family N-acetyltransferase [Frankiales bacterium]|nr:GNAT family N-acetyltransferase [Frankiales bacterium]
MQQLDDPSDDDGQAFGPLHDGRTTRLSLRRPTGDDVADLFRMYSDSHFWQDDPLLRHTSIAQTESQVERSALGWQLHGLGPWVVRTLIGSSAGDLVGMGGCSLPSPAAWNLAFSLRPEMWGQGYAQEVAAAARRCARTLRPGLPITAVAAARNERSQRALERAGLSGVWRGPDTKDPDPAAELLLYSDRPLSPEQVHVLTA